MVVTAEALPDAHKPRTELSEHDPSPDVEQRRREAWKLLQSPLPDEATRLIDDGPNKGLEDINDAFIHERLLQARLDGLEVYYEAPIMNTVGKATAVFKRGKPDEYEVEEWIVECDWPITIDGLRVVGCGAHQTADLGNARKGAKTSAFKDTLKYFGIALEVRKRGRSDDARGSENKARKAAKQAEADVTEQVKVAYAEKGKEWPKCPDHGDSITMKKTSKGWVISCSSKSGGSFCNKFKTVWDNQIPEYYKAIGEGALNPVIDGDVDPDDVPF